MRLPQEFVSLLRHRLRDANEPPAMPLQSKLGRIYASRRAAYLGAPWLNER